jgi:hypothetical protein
MALLGVAQTPDDYSASHLFKIKDQFMGDRNLAPVCGLYCGQCEYFGKECAGCGYVEGKPFWASALPTGTCPFHQCCRNDKNLEHCGLCGDCPCQMFSEVRDPSLSDEAFAESLSKRQKALKRRAKIGTDAWLLEVAGS